MNILTLSCRTHSIKFHLFTWGGESLLAAGDVKRVGLGGTSISLKVTGRENETREVEFVDHRGAVSLILAILDDPRHGIGEEAVQIGAVGHRVAHGGEQFRHSVVIDDQVLEAIRDLQQLAPLHNAANIAGIEAAAELLPHIPHVAIFDTAFHVTMPDFAYIYPLPYEWYKKFGVRRYGFHGPSHIYLSRRAAMLLGKRAAACNLITIHIEKGVSLCAIKNGVSIDTSMGLTPLEGAVMETRSGDFDAGITPFIMQQLNLSAREIESILNQKSGMLGITGLNTDRRHILEAASTGHARCKLALKMEAYRLKKYIGAYLAAVGPLDAVVFTTGVGEWEWLARELTLEGLECFGILPDPERNRAARSEREEALITADASPVKVFVMPTDEELVFAQDVTAILAGEYSDHQHYDYSFARPDFVPLRPAA
ncbi:acetate kinase [Oryzomonas sagensis]|uniref:Acetate kinase n=1 Tax=Oryzomonas sagensis TaxID=2603857 RepID=A0ABQ6TK03_9BACT|nr:acetate kinase [Oryzomonas sagensis]KAB0668272.1 acetate kinase [Oryzomonas sagensis]